MAASRCGIFLPPHERIQTDLTLYYFLLPLFLLISKEITPLNFSLIPPQLNTIYGIVTVGRERCEGSGFTT
jgi:hypothetical protein